MVLLAAAVAGLAQEAPAGPGSQLMATVPPGVPLRVVLEHRVGIKRVGQPVEGRLIEPIYVFDRVVLPAGSIVKGHVAEIDGVPARKRLTALLSGNLTPHGVARAQFDAMALTGGTLLPLRTSLSRGTAHTARIAAPPPEQKTNASKGRGPRDRLEEIHPAAIRAFKAPGKMSRLKSALLGMLPYHRREWRAGTLFNAALGEPLTVAAPGLAAAPGDYPAIAESETREVSARLLTSISSASAGSGAPVEAVVTRPLFSTDHRLLIPEGSRLLGDVVKAQPARRLHRNGKLLFVFRQVKLPERAAQNVQGYLEGVDADRDAQLALDAEGATRVSNPKTRLIFPAIAAAAAGLSIHQDYNAQGVPDQDLAGRAESGAVGLGLIGTLLAQTSRTVASGIAFSGAAFSFYTSFIARGEDVFLPANTPVTVSLRARGGGDAAGQPVKR